MTHFALDAPGGRITMRVSDRFEEVEAEWRHLMDRAGPAEHAYADPDFVAAWARHVAPERGIVPRYHVFRRDDEPIGLLPVGLGREGGMPMLLALSDSHTNFNGGVFAPGWDVAPTALHRTMLAAEPQAEGLWVCCVPGVEGRHPLLSVPCPSVHDGHGGSFADGFDAHLARNGGKRKRKKHRQAARRFERAGGWSVERVRDPNEAVRLLDEARALFAERFARDGIADPFADTTVRSFMADLLVASCDGERAVMALWKLEIDGKVVAIQAGGGTGDAFSLMFMVYRPGPFDACGPGEFLLYEVLSKAADAGYRSFDLGRGREPYKVSWCDVAIPLHDVRVARTARAKLWMAAHARAANLKKRVRENDRLWELAKTVRRGLARAA